MSPQYSFDRKTGYRIEIAGSRVFPGFDEAAGIKDISTEISDDGEITVLTGEFDQAGLLGLLRRMYYTGTPLISVNPVDETGRKSGRN